MEVASSIAQGHHHCTGIESFLPTRETNHLVPRGAYSWDRGTWIKMATSGSGSFLSIWPKKLEDQAIYIDLQTPDLEIRDALPQVPELVHKGHRLPSKGDVPHRQREVRCTLIVLNFTSA
jgi:hypothetical protein